MQRRHFLATCASGALLASADGLRTAAAQGAPRYYGHARLVDTEGRPLRASSVPIRQNLVFHYPYRGTPAFLLNLGAPVEGGTRVEPSGSAAYAWPGGIGPWRSIVAYCAICAHQMAYPRRENSFIAFRDRPGRMNTRPDVIHCCAEHSEYDPAAGAQVLSGPATRPLTTILLQYDPRTDELAAIGTQGPELYDAFFDKYDVQLAMAHQGLAREPVRGDCVVEPLERFTRHRVEC